MVTIHASSADELCSQLEQIDISVPSRGGARNNERVETWTVCRLMASLADTVFIDQPIALTSHNEQEGGRPDFLAISDGTIIGIEVTECIDEQFARYMKLANDEFPNAILDPSHFGWTSRTRKWTENELRELLCQEKLTGPGWVGDQPEREWTEYINYRIDNKLQILAKCGFKKFDSNWLAIYDNLPYGDLDVELAVSYLRPKIEHIWSVDPAFDAIFVESRNQIVRITADGSEIIPLNNLWKN
ncbi:hypothetical protein GQF03_03815 [Sneathiella chungangensis]|uniref:Uncharacterized protein n=1 Tax=Sneathiella chungangensis TaxID=1418234 RepID=A0A845MDJ7_9PROT|nr:hypothetical protein [Sneathiella chungangensis]MZR21450.1 hypothetical protein [Sneathiella chungangensis]